MKPKDSRNKACVRLEHLISIVGAFVWLRDDQFRQSDRCDVATAKRTPTEMLGDGDMPPPLQPQSDILL